MACDGAVQLWVKLFKELHTFNEVALIEAFLCSVVPSQWYFLLPQKGSNCHNAAEVFPSLCELSYASSLQLLDEITLSMTRFEALFMISECVQGPFPFRKACAY